MLLVHCMLHLKEKCYLLNIVLKTRLDAYFSKYKVGIEVDEYDNEDANSNYEESREFMIESHEITVTRTNHRTNP